MKTKIEPGCLAVIVGRINSTDIGKVVTAVKYVGRIREFVPQNLWLVDNTITYFNGPNKTNKFPYVPEDCLMRIDGHEVESKERKEILHC